MTKKKVNDEFSEAAVETINAAANFLTSLADVIEGCQKMNRSLKKRQKVPAE